MSSGDDNQKDIETTMTNENVVATDTDMGGKRKLEEENDGTTSHSNNNNNNNNNNNDKAEPITKDGEMPQKKFYRARAHCNPLSHNDNFDYPTEPNQMDWSSHYPAIATTSSSSTVTVAPNVLDVGCGFGGLTIALSTLLPHHIILGLEIRAKVTEYVRLRIMAHRKESNEYNNVSVMRSNTMKFMPNLFQKESLEKIFFCFPDPHFKRKNHPRRIISKNLLTEYAYFLKPGIGKLYCITDVEELHQWHVDKCNAHPLFRKLSTSECDADPCVKAMYNETEEGKKVQRAGANKYYAVYQRLSYTNHDDHHHHHDTNNHDHSPPLVTAENFWDTNQFNVISSPNTTNQEKQ